MPVKTIKSIFNFTIQEPINVVVKNQFQGKNPSFIGQTNAPMQLR